MEATFTVCWAVFIAIGIGGAMGVSPGMADYAAHDPDLADDDLQEFVSDAFQAQGSCAQQ